MEQIANAGTNAMTVLDELAAQAQMFSCGAAMNLLQLGRVLCEAKPLVQHGEWSEWVRVNAHMPIRTAQQYMQAYKKFGTGPKYAQLGASQIIRLLPMSDDEREKLLSENDVGEMTTRELDEAIRTQREAARAEADAEAGARIAEAMRERDELQQRLNAMEAKRDNGKVPKKFLDELKRREDELKEAEETSQHFAELAKQATADKAAMERQLRAAQDDLQDAEKSIAEQQEALNKAQEELLSIRSAQARGDASHDNAGELTADTFGAAVREFVGQCARMPYMGGTFAGMTQKEKARYSELLRTVEGFCAQARAALESVAIEGGVVHG